MGLWEPPFSISGACTMCPFWSRIGKWILFSPLNSWGKAWSMNPMWRGRKGVSISSFYNEEVPLLSNRLVLVLEPCSSRFVFSFSIYSLWFWEKSKVHIQWVPLCGRPSAENNHVNLSRCTRLLWQFFTFCHPLCNSFGLRCFWMCDPSFFHFIHGYIDYGSDV